MVVDHYRWLWDGTGDDGHSNSSDGMVIRVARMIMMRGPRNEDALALAARKSPLLSLQSKPYKP